MQKHINNKYFRVQDAMGHTFVMVPERDFIQHTKLIQEQDLDIQTLRKDLEWKNKQLASAVQSYEKLNTNYYLDVNKARILQREQDAKAYSWWKKEAGKYKALYRDLNKEVYFGNKDAVKKQEAQVKILKNNVRTLSALLYNRIGKSTYIAGIEEYSDSTSNAF